MACDYVVGRLQGGRRVKLLAGGWLRLGLRRRVGQLKRLEEIVEVLEVFAAQAIPCLSFPKLWHPRSGAIVPRMSEIRALRELETWTAGNILGAVVLVVVLAVAIVVLIRRYLND